MNQTILEGLAEANYNFVREANLRLEIRRKIPYINYCYRCKQIGPMLPAIMFA